VVPRGPWGADANVSRTFDRREFDRVYDDFIVRGRFQEVSAYYPRYKSRYQYLIQRFAALAPSAPADVLDIGGGQLALLCRMLWGDRGTVADLPGPHFDYLASKGLQQASWNLNKPEQPFTAAFDAIFFSEVIEHIPIPGHIVLERLRRALKPGGLLICSTPNLYRLRNIVYMILGKRIFANFMYPEDLGIGHVVEYSQEHLRWQFDRAGFADTPVELCELRHWPNRWSHKILMAIGYPLTWVPHFRGNLVAVGKA
jgi:2-polyprenyl-3-methyl-5-hydroxy-6-metoxy-1,4-benzoquinol methylase